MPVLRSFVLLTPLLLACQTHAWGPAGHEIVAHIADHWLTAQTRVRVENILSKDPDSTSYTLMDVSTWADGFGRTREGDRTRPFHYIGISENPLAAPSRCDLPIPSDYWASETCIVTAIASYTKQLSIETVDSGETARAVKFITHLIGDVTQPLHTEPYKRGGNGIKIRWKRNRKNLHQLWDGLMVQETLHINSWGIRGMAANIIRELKTTSRSKISSWIACTDPKTSAKCAAEWAMDSHQLVCSHVMPMNFNRGDLSEEYYMQNAPVVEEQLAKGGVRLAAYLNMLFSGRSGFEWL